MLGGKYYIKGVEKIHSTLFSLLTLLSWKPSLPKSKSKPKPTYRVPLSKFETNWFWGLRVMIGHL